MTAGVQASWIVLKFGGTSVSTLANWRNIAAVVARRRADGAQILIVHSAVSGITDRLERLLVAALAGEHEAALSAIEAAADLTGWQVEVAGHKLSLTRTYGHVPPGELLALVNSFGLVEVACHSASAAQVLAAGPGLPVVLRSPQSQ